MEMEQALKFVTKHFPQPDADAWLWKYMDFTQFMFLVSERRLHFTRPDDFQDRFEGALPKSSIAGRGVFTLHQKSDTNQSYSTKTVSTMSHEIIRGTCAISCWHANAYESEAMWKVYSAKGQGIAVRTTLARLQNAIDMTAILIVSGMVEYIDHATSDYKMKTGLDPLMLKRMSYKHETEFRLIAFPYSEARHTVIALPMEPDGLSPTVDLIQLIDAVYVEPTTPAWIFNFVKSVLRKNGVLCDVHRSSLEETPPW